MNRKTLFTALLLLLGRNVCSAGEPGPTIRFAEIPAGWFYMGSGGPGADYDETPIHKVVISRPFRMSVTEITNAQYEAFDPSHRALRGKQGFSSGDNEAVIFVDWHQADAFCRWLSEKEGRTYRLPTEAEWEYACRAGSCMHYSFGDRLPKAALKNQEEHHSFIPVDLTVAQSAPNAFGLYDMHGNVEEWCYDWYGPYFRGDQTDPVGYADGFYKVTRGGSHSTPRRIPPLGQPHGHDPGRQAFPDRIPHYRSALSGHEAGSRFHRRRTCSATRRTLGRYERPTALLHPHRIRHTAAYLRSTDVSPQPLSGSHVVP